MKELPPRPKKRPGSDNYYLRKRTPQDVVKAYGKKETMISLGTSNYKEALQEASYRNGKIRRRKTVNDYLNTYQSLFG
jgi:hypothetical protein